MQHENVYIAIEDGVFDQKILGVYKLKKDAEDMINACGGEYDLNDDGPRAILRRIETHNLIN